MRYIVFGSGGFAKEVIDYVEDDNHEIVAVVSTTKFNSGSYAKRYKVIDSVNESLLDTYPDAKFLLAVGDVNVKKIIVGKNVDRWGSFIHSSSHISRRSKMGKGVVVCPYATVLGDSIIGNFVTLNVYTCVAHDNVVGNYSTYSPYAGTMGNCTIGDDCFFGTSAYCIPGVSLANGCKVSAGSFVRKSHQTENDVLIGNPAKPKP